MQRHWWAGWRTRWRHEHRPLKKNGQAIIEFVVGLIAVLVLFAGLYQLGLLAQAHTEVMINAREEAAENVITPKLNLKQAPYISSWNDGDDEVSYSADDESINGNIGAVSAGIVVFAHPEALGQSVGPNSISALAMAPNLLMNNMQSGHDSSGPIKLLPAVQNLLYAAESIELECEVWLVTGENIY
jgi:hypothetical protein